MTAAEVLTRDQVDRAIARIAHEIAEKHPETSSLVVIGMQSGGVWIAERLAGHLARIAEAPLTGSIDVSMYRDDISMRPVTPVAPSRIPVDLAGRTVVLVDDVLYTGRTVRAALAALNDHGRPGAVRLAVMVDRGHRELPIRPDFVGKNIPTHLDDEVSVGPEGVIVARPGADA